MVRMVMVVMMLRMVRLMRMRMRWVRLMVVAGKVWQHQIHPARVKHLIVLTHQ